MVKVERLSENRVKLVVTVSAEQFDLALDAAFNKVVKDVKVDGFRPGKLPKSIYISRFGWESLYNEAIEFAFQATYPMALREAEVYPVDDPKVDLVDPAAIEKGKSFDYTVEVDVWPNVHLGEYKGVKVKKQSTRVLKKDVEAYINNVLKGKAENIIKEGAAELGDTVVIDFEGFVDGVAFEGGKGENYPLTIGSGAFIPGFEEQLVGAELEKEVEVNVTFPAEYHAPDLAGKEAVFKCTVHEIKVKEMPELDDEFASEVSEFDTLEEFKADLKAKLVAQKEAEARRAKEDAVVEKAVANATMEIPEAMIATQANQMAQEFAQRLQAQGLSVEQYFEFTGLTAEKMLDELKPQAVKRIQTRLVLEAIAKAEGFVTTEEKFEAEIAKMAEMYKMEADKLKSYMGEEEKKQMKEDMAVQEAVTFLIENAVEA